VAVTGYVLSRLFELSSEVQIFLSDTTSDLSNRFTDEMLLSKLTYAADIFCSLSGPSKSLRGFCTTQFSVHNKMKAFRKNLASLLKNSKWTSVFVAILEQFLQ
jgi:hypothetical protein